MDFQTFERRAREIYATVPDRFLEGIDGLEVSLRTELHPTLPEVFTLGECLTEHYPSEFGGAGEVRSIVVLYYGSFLELARRDEAFDWEGELYETITHEVRHHLESLAAENQLEEIDYAEDQNFHRRQGEPFDPFFFRAGNLQDDGSWEVGGDLFLEVPVDRRRARPILVAWQERRLIIDHPEPLGDVHYLTLEPWSDDSREVVAVVQPKQPWWRWVGALLGMRKLDVRAGVLEEADEE